MAFAPASQYPHPSTFNIVVINSKLPGRTLVSTLNRELSKRHPGLVVTGGDFQKSIRDGMVQERVMAILSGFFGLIAAVMAAGGLYGVMSYLMSSPRSELGIRLPWERASPRSEGW